LNRAGSRVATASWPVIQPGASAEVKVWDAASGQPIFEIREPCIHRVSLSPDGELLAVTGIRDEKAKLGKAPQSSWFVRVYSLKDWVPGATPLRELSGNDEEFYGLSFSHDGKRLAVAGNRATVLIWDLSQQKPIISRQGCQGDRPLDVT